jgi:hypothetical protein
MRGAQLVLVLAGAGAAYWTYTRVRDGRLPPNGQVVAALTAIQAAGAVIAIGSLLVR